HYFKERRPLKLQTERVAILQARTAAVNGLGQALPKFGLAPEETRALPIAGWSVAGTPAASHTEVATRDLVSRMSGDGAFEFAEPDMIFTGKGDLIPNDPGFTNLWAMQNTIGTIGLDMKGPQAWDITTGSSNIIVVILDVGIQPDHPDINQIPGTNLTGDASS